MSGGAAAPEVIPTDSGDSQSKFGNLIDAISQINQLSVMELSGQEIPKDFFTLRSWVNYFQAGFGNGFLEGLLFAVLTATTLPFASDETLSNSVAYYFPLVKSTIFLGTINCLPLILTVVLCSHLSKVKRGNITGKAIDALLFGRSFCLVVKGILLYVCFILLHRFLTEENIKEIATWFAIRSIDVAESVYRILLNVQPQIIPTAYITLGIFMLAVLTPFFTTWLTSFYRSSLEKKATEFWAAE